MLRNLKEIILKLPKNKPFFVSQAQLHGTAKNLNNEELSVPDGKLGDRMHEVLSKYTTDEAEKILKIVNNYKLNELLSYEISKQRANKLLAWRMRNGLLKSLDDILFIEGFGLKITDKFYKSLLQEPKPADAAKEKSGRQKTAPFVTPSIEPEHSMHIKTCVALRIGVNSVTWSRLLLSADDNVPCQLTHWEHHEISEKKIHLNDLVHRCLYIEHRIPMADSYLFENPQMAQASNNPGSVEQQNINIQKAQVIAMMGYALAARNSCEELDVTTQVRPKVFYLRRFLAARLFNHLVGTERVSTEQIIIDMMRTYYNLTEERDFIESNEEYANDLSLNYVATEQSNDKTRLNFRGNVQFPADLRQVFSNTTRHQREFLGQSLLLNLAFVRLVLLQDAQSIAMVSRGGAGAGGSASSK